jgi:hypothetical protein
MKRKTKDGFACHGAEQNRLFLCTENAAEESDILHNT